MFGNAAYQDLNISGDFVDISNNLFGSERATMSARERESKAIWYMGNNGTSTSLHYHSSAWNVLVEGRKRWYFVPPYELWGPPATMMSTWEKEWLPQFLK